MTGAKYKKRDVIDNQDNNRMYNVLNANIPKLDGLDISSGFFDVKGYNLVHEKLRKKLQNPSFEFRLLLGANAITVPAEDFEVYKKQYELELEENMPLSHDLDRQDMNMKNQDEAQNLIETLSLDNVLVRRNRKRFNHSKCYIFNSEIGVIIGSSNFTGNGLEKNYELNAALYQAAPYETATKWFEAMWKNADDVKDELKNTVLNSKFGRPPIPFWVYSKMIFEMFKDLIKAVDDKSDSAKRLTRFQRDAVDIAIQIISEHDGVIIADSTGLGKTNMGMAIMRRKNFNEHRKTLLIAPAQVLNSMWTAKLADEDMAVRTETMESLGRKDFDDKIYQYKKYDLVIIDESQNFRSKTANKRHNLMKLMSVGKKKQVVLLTATPINNSIMDLYYQLSIITGGDDAHFADSVGISDLYEHMREAANRDKFQDKLEKIQQLLDSVMIRRTRSYIEEVYKDDRIDGRPIEFPDHQFVPIRYSMAELYGNIFAKIKEIDKLNMTPYRVESYNESIPKEDRKKFRVLGYLQRTLLLKRFESSKTAAEKSIDTMIRLYKHVRVILDDGRIPNVKELSRILNKHQGDDNDDRNSDQADKMIDEINKIGTQSAKDYDMVSMKKDIESDLARLDEFKQTLAGITMDKKLDAVHEMILKDRALETESKKVLVFTEYVTTAEYLEKEFKRRFPDKDILLITGKKQLSQRQKIIRSFAPKANFGEDDPDLSTTDILISTEVLSEGQNLQDCNYVINYDLPWNPMRIVQRVGRIDRLTSEHEIVRSRACYPDAELNAILGLLEKLAIKIDVANKAVGLDEELLGVSPEDVQFNEKKEYIKKLAEGGADIGDEIKRLQHDSDMMPDNSPFNMINRLVKDRGIEVMEGMAMGRRSGIRGDGQKAILGYLQERPKRRFYFVKYDYEDNSTEVVSNQADALKMISCTDKTRTHLPMDMDDHKRSFTELVKIDKDARKAIKDDEQATRERAGAIRKTKRDRYFKKINGVLDLILTANYDGKISDEDARRLNDILQSEHLISWEVDIDRIFAEHKDDDDLEGLKKDIERLANLIDVDKKEGKVDDESEDIESEPKLVGAMFITGEKFDPKIGKSGMDKHI